MGKHEHEKRKSTREAKDSKPKPEKVKSQSKKVKPLVSLVSLAGDPWINEYILNQLVKTWTVDYQYIKCRQADSTCLGLRRKKAHRRGKVYNWKTATYGKIWYDKDVHDLRSVETKFPAIVFNDTLTSKVALSREPAVSPLNDNQIDFRISFDESDDEDYMVIYDKNSFSYKMNSVNDLKTDSENDNDKVNMPSFPSPEPTVGYFDDLDYLKDFEKEFPAIVYNDALTSKSDFLTEPTMSPQHINESNLKDETS
ncbi:hypothetical protein Tco_0948935 [Tanacetum coccineum]